MKVETKQDVNNFLSELLKLLVSLIEEKDEFMRGHAQRVASNCVHFSRKLNLSKSEIEKIYFAGLLHDIAMVYVPIEFFQKSGSLNESEITEVKQHPAMAEKILSNLSFFKGILPIIRHHHEAFDGSGYPDGLKGDEIPLGARILSLVDSYDAMTSVRSFTPAMNTKEALSEIVNKAGKQFDKNLIKDFIEYIGSISGSVNGNKPKKGKEIDHNTVNKILQKYINHNVDLPVLPKVVQNIEKVINQPNSTSDKVAKAVEKDAAISIRLISVANSPVYRGTEKISTVNQAIPRLGIKETRSIVAAIASESMYETKNDQFRLLMEKLWLHSLACAFGSSAIAKTLRLGNLEQFFLMGLIHDIGKPPLFKVLDEKIPQDESISMPDIIAGIQEVHAGFGGKILDHWGFTRDFTRIAVQHEGPNFSQKTEKAILIVNVANSMARKIGYSIFNGEVDLSELESVKLLNIDPKTLNPISEEIKKMMQNTAPPFS